MSYQNYPTYYQTPPDVHPPPSSPHEEAPLLQANEYVPRQRTVYRRIINRKKGGIFWSLLCMCLVLLLISIIISSIMIAYVVKCSHSDHTETHIYSADAKSVTNYEILNHEGDIFINRSDSNSQNVTITVTRHVGYSRYFGDFEGRFTYDNTNVRYEEKITRENFFHWLGSCKNSQITVNLPKKLAEGVKIYVSQDLGKVVLSHLEDSSLESISIFIKLGDMIFTGVGADQIDARTHGGNIKFDQVSGTKMSFSTNSGDIKHMGKIKLQKSKDNNIRPSLQVSSNYGDIDIRGIEYETDSDVRVETSIGKISLKNTKFGGSFYLMTKSGNTIVSGEVHYDKNERGEKKGTFGHGNSTLNAKCLRGDIEAAFA